MDGHPEFQPAEGVYKKSYKRDHVQMTSARRGVKELAHFADKQY